jgi:transposase InsO family protein
MTPRIMRRLRCLSTVLDDFSRYIIAWEAKLAKGQPVHHHMGRGRDQHAGPRAQGLGL